VPLRLLLESVGLVFIMSSASTEDGGDVPAGMTGGPSRPRPIRFISPATLNLHRVYEQNRQRLQKKDGAKVPDPTTPQTKGKPRLLLMGQRRYGLLPLVVFGVRW
jgi:Ras-related GTP-binding protein C/D